MEDMEQMLNSIHDSSWDRTSWELGRADLEAMLVHFYERTNPAKVSDAYSVSQEWYGNESELSKMLYNRYKVRLT